MTRVDAKCHRGYGLGACLILVSLWWSQGFAHASRVEYDPSQPDTFDIVTTPQYLGTSPEVTFDQELLALAAELSHDPVQIYRWVYEHIELEHYSYWAARKGALATSLTQRGNRWDQCALLIALLRISGIPARFAEARLIPVMPFVQAWLSRDLVHQPDGYKPGVVKHGRWYPLVPWQKQKKQISPGIPLFGEGAERSVPTKLAKLADEYLDLPKNLTSIEWFEEKLQEYLDEHHPGSSVADVPQRWVLPPRTITGIPLTLPDGMGKQPRQYYYPDDLPDNRRIRISIRAWDAETDAELATWTLPTAQIAARVTYVYAKPVASGQVVPLLGLEDGTTEQGQAISASHDILLQATYQPLTENAVFDRETNARLQAGAVSAFAIDMLSGSPQVTHRISEQLFDRFETTNAIQIMSIMGATIAASYMEGVYRSWQRVAALTHVMLGDYANHSFDANPIGNEISPSFLFAAWTYASLPQDCAEQDAHHCLGDLHHVEGPQGYLPKWTFYLSETSAARLHEITAQHLLPPLDARSDFSKFIRQFISHELSFQESESIERWTHASAHSTLTARLVAKEMGLEEYHLDKSNIDADGNIFAIDRQGNRRYLSANGYPVKLLAILKQVLTNNSFLWVKIPERPFDLPGLPERMYIYAPTDVGSARYYMGTAKGGEGGGKDGDPDGDDGAMLNRQPMGPQPGWSPVEPGWNPFDTELTDVLVSSDNAGITEFVTPGGVGYQITNHASEVTVVSRFSTGGPVSTTYGAGATLYVQTYQDGTVSVDVDVASPHVHIPSAESRPLALKILKMPGPVIPSTTTSTSGLGDFAGSPSETSPFAGANTVTVSDMPGFEGAPMKLHDIAAVAIRGDVATTDNFHPNQKDGKFTVFSQGNTTLVLETINGTATIDVSKPDANGMATVVTHIQQAGNPIEGSPIEGNQITVEEVPRNHQILTLEITLTKGQVSHIAFVDTDSLPLASDIDWENSLTLVFGEHGQDLSDSKEETTFEIPANTISATTTEMDPETGEIPVGPEIVKDRNQATTPDNQSLGNDKAPTEVASDESKATGGDPVNLITGEFYTEELDDIRLPSGVMDLAVRRSYRSQLNRDGIFGYGWTWNHSETIGHAKDGTGIVYRDAEGTVHRIDKDDQGNYQPPPGVTYRVKTEGIKTVLEYADGRAHTFLTQGGMLLEKRHPNGQTLSFGYDIAKGHLVTIKDRFGQVLSFVYDDVDRYVKRIFDHHGRSVHYKVDARGDLVAFSNLAGQITWHWYLKDQADARLNHNMTHYLLPYPSGAVFSSDFFTMSPPSLDVLDNLPPSATFLKMDYYANDRVRSHTNADDKTFRFRYDPINRQAQIEDETEVTWQKIFWNKNHDIVRKTFADGSFELREYDDYHNMTMYQDPNGNRYTYEYDTDDDQKDPRRCRNLRNVVAPTGEKTQYFYTNKNFNVVTRMILPTGHTVEFDYDARGNLDEIRRQLSIGPLTHAKGPRYKLNESGEVVATGNGMVTQARVLTTKFDYDDNGNVEKRTDTDDTGLSQAVTFTYTPSGLYLDRIEAPRGANATFRYDPLVSVTQPVTVIDALDYESHVTYDALERVTKTIDRAGHETTVAYHENGQPSLVTNAKGQAATWHYDGPARDLVQTPQPSAIVDSLGARTEFAYNPVGNLMTLLDAKQNTTRFRYDKMHRLIWQRDDTLRGEEHLAYDANGNRILHIDPKGGQTLWQYDDLNRVIRVQDPLIQATEIAYRYSDTLPFRSVSTPNSDTVVDRHRVRRVQTHRGLTQESYFDVRGLVVETMAYETAKGPDSIEAPARRVRLEYDGLGRLIRRTDPDGNQTHQSYDDSGNVILIVRTDAQDNIVSHTAYEYDLRNQVTKQIDALGHETVFTYDGEGRIVTVTNAQNVTTSYDYDALGNVIAITDGHGNQTTLEYDDGSRPTAVTNPLGHTTWQVYNKHGERTQVIDPLQYATEFEYDSRSRLIRQTDATGVFARFEYDLTSNLTAQIDALGGRTEFTYDPLYRVQSVTNALGHMQEVIRNGNVIESIDALRNPVTTELSPFGETNTLTDAKGAQHTFTQDVLDGTIKATQLGQSSSADGTLASQHLPDRTETDHFNALGRIREQTLADGTTIKHEYDKLGRRTQVLVKLPGQDEFSLEQEFDYDALSRLTLAIDHNQGRRTHAVEMHYDELGRLDWEIQGSQVQDGLVKDGYVIDYDYNEASQRTSITYPVRSDEASESDDKLAPLQLTLTYDGRGLPESLRDAAEPSVARHKANFAYDAAGRPKTVSVESPRGSTTAVYATEIDYDEKGRESERTFSWTLYGILVPLISMTQGYDAVDNVTERRKRIGNQVTSQQYRYDAENRLVSADVSDGNLGDRSLYWIYDAVGNWLETNQNDTDGDGQGDVETRIPNPHDQYEGLKYDGRGNLEDNGRGVFRYDWQNRMVTGQRLEPAPGPQVTFTYDALGRRVTKQVTEDGEQAAETTRYLYDGLDVIEERNHDGAVLRQFIHGPGIDQPLVMIAGDTSYYYAQDAQGSVVALATSEGSIIQERYHYDPYGHMTVTDAKGDQHSQSQLGNPYGYTGRRWDDELGLWHYRNRMYDAKLGRFCQNDPLGFVDGTNRQVYVSGNPATKVDPLGLAERQRTDSFDFGKAPMSGEVPEFTTADFFFGRGTMVGEGTKRAGRIWDIVPDAVQGAVDRTNRALDFPNSSLANVPFGINIWGTKGVGIQPVDDARHLEKVHAGSATGMHSPIQVTPQMIATAIQDLENENIYFDQDFIYLNGTGKRFGGEGVQEKVDRLSRGENLRDPLGKKFGEKMWLRSGHHTIVAMSILGKVTQENVGLYHIRHDGFTRPPIGAMTVDTINIFDKNETDLGTARDILNQNRDSTTSKVRISRKLPSYGAGILFAIEGTRGTLRMVELFSGQLPRGFVQPFIHSTKIRNMRSKGILVDSKGRISL